MFKRKLQQYNRVKDSTKVTPKNRVVVKESGFTPDVTKRHPFNRKNRRM